MQEITRHLSDIETELSNLGRVLEDVRQQIREVSDLVKLNSSITIPPKKVTQKPARETDTSGKRRKAFSYGSTYRPDKWMNTSASAVVANGIQETWSVGDEISNTSIYSGLQDEFGTNSFIHSARQSEYSIHARP